jgi:hypothetical protein
MKYLVIHCCRESPIYPPPPSSGSFIPEFGAHLEACLFEYLAQVTVLVHCTDVVGPTDGLAAQDHVGEGAAPRQACEHGLDEVAVICKDRRRCSFPLCLEKKKKRRSRTT